MKSLLRFCFTLSSLFLLYCINGNAQFFCGMDNASKGQNGLLSRTTTCDIDLSEVTTKTIRVTVHVFQDDNGNNNIPNTTSGRDFIEDYVKKGQVIK